MKFPKARRFSIAMVICWRRKSSLLAAFLFGILYQGGSELAFEMPGISREMIVVIQGLVIMFTGSLENLVRMPVTRLFTRFKRGAV